MKSKKKSLIQTQPPCTPLMLLILVLLLPLAQSQSATLTTASNAVNAQTLLTFSVVTGQSITTSSCIKFDVTNPYTINPEYYTAFATGTTCAVTSSHSVSCTRVSSTQMQMSFTAASTTQTVTGNLNSFRNPYSKINVKVTASFYSNCAAISPSFSSTTEFTQITSGTISTITMSSSSNTIGQQNLVLTLSFNPTTIMKQSGIIQFIVPYWYDTGVSSSNLFYMLDSTSVVSSSTSGVTVGTGTLAPSTGTYSFTFTSTAEITSSTTVTFQFTNFRNPISSSAKSGFFLKSLDNEGRVIDETITSQSFAGPTGAATITSSSMEFRIDGDTTSNTQVAGTNRVVYLSFTVNVPLEQTCFVQVTFPDTVRIDVDESLLAYVGTGFMQATQTIASNSQVNKLSYASGNSITFPSCIQTSQLFQSTQPGTITFSRVVSTRQISPIGTFTITVAKDSTLSTVIASGTITPSITMTSGTITLTSFTPVTTSLVQSSSTYQISFVLTSSLFSTSLIVITLPTNLDVSSVSSCTLTNHLNIDSSASCSYSSGVITISNAFTDTSTYGFDFIASGQTMQVTFNSAANPYSTANAGAWSIQTYNVVSGVNRLVDEGTSTTSFTPTVAAFASNIASITVTNPITYSTSSTYTFQFTLSRKFTANSRVLITPPSTVGLNSGTLSCSQTVGGVSTSRSCSISSSRIQITLTSSFVAGDTIIVSVSGFRNPRSFLPASGFLVQTADSSNNAIEESSDFSVTMTTMGSMTSVTVTPSNKTNGVTTTYQISFLSTIPFETGDIINLNFPSDVTLTSSTRCNLGGTSSQTCTVSGQQLRVTITSSGISSTTLDLRVTNVVNPPNTRTTGTFTSIYSFLTSSNINYNIQQLTSNLPTVTNTAAAHVQTYSISSNDTKLTNPAVYTIRFTPYNKISSTGSIVLYWPTSVTIYSNVTVTITTSRSQTTYTSLSTSSREIVWEGLFSSSYQSEITIELNPVYNPTTSQDLQGFYIYTYDDANQAFAIDKIEDLKPLLACDYPCKTCQSTNKSDCISCFTDQEMKFLQFFSSKGTCLARCADGYTTNGDFNTYACLACDASCATCQDRNIVGDRFTCIRCASGYNFRSSDGRCHTSCTGAYYQSSSSTCGMCLSPCATCSGTASNCTSCLATTVTPYLYNNQCVRECPAGTARVGNICQKCQSPCATCTDAVTKCTSCNQNQAAKYFYGYQCYETCPNGTSTDSEEFKCFGCQSGCDICDPFDQTYCKKCSSGLLMYQGKCVTSCPKFYQANFMKTECVPIQDFPLIYFPHIITCLVLTGIAVGGYIRDKKSLILSNTILLCGPIEFISFLSQIGLTFLFADYMYAILAIVAVIIYVAINIAFTLYFHYKIAKQDPDYQQWQSMNPKTSKVILCLSGILSSKVLRLHYSYLFGIDNFKTSFQNPQVFQKALIGFTSGQMASNILMIIYDLSGFLVDFEWGTQLYIVMLETCIISVILIVLEIVEFFKLNQYLSGGAYQQVFSDSVMNVSEMDQNFDKKMREDMLKNIMGKVRNNQDLFLNNKLDDLFNKFGDRRCNSMIQFENDREEDPRRTKSLPASPQSDFKFDKDAYMKDRFPDNVFAESQPPNPLGRVGKSFVDADTQVQGSDIDKILARKGGDFVNFEASESSRRRDKKNRRRGRKNQYYTQIDAEDDEEVENNEDMDGDDLDVIKEEDEQEEQREKAERKRLKDEEERKQREAAELEDRKRREAEEQRKKKEEEERLKKEQEFKEQEEKIEQERLERERQEQLKREEQARLQKLEEERLLKEQEELDKKRKEEAEKLQQQQQQKEEEERKKIEEEAAQKQMIPKLSASQIPDHASQKSGVSDDKTGLNQNVLIEDSLNEFSKMMHPEAEVQAPPDAEKRTFNENDILGDFDRDEKGNVIVLQDEQGRYIDKQGRLVNERGYLINQNTGDIIENQNNKKMFDKQEIDERGEIPAPFCVEKHNFNPFNLRGNFDYNKQGEPLILQNKQKELVDKNGRRVNKQGWLIDNMGNLADVHGRKKFDKKQLVDGVDLPKLFNYGGRRFDILDICGQFDKDSNGNITFRRKKQGQLIDNTGRPVNEKGYLIDANENIINKEGKKIFDKKHLKQGEIPKIFPFTHFKIKNVLGNFEMDPIGNPILDKRPNDDLVDRDGKVVNKRGYLINANGDVIDKYGKIMFDKDILDEEGEIPKVFRTGLLKSDSASSLSRLMSEIERTQPFEGDSDYQRIQSELQKMKKDGDGQEQTARRNSAGTSIDSLMEETPSNYDIANQRFGAAQKMKNNVKNSKRNQQQIEEEDSYGDEDPQFNQGRRRIAKKKKKTAQGFRDPSEKDILMAKAYGGIARAQPKRVMPKTSNNRMMTAESGGNDPRTLQKLAGSISGFHKDMAQNQTISRDRLNESPRRDPFRDHVSQTNQSFLNGTNEPSIMAVPDHHIREQRLKQKKMNELKQKSKMAPKRKQGAGDPDFEKMFGKDIDEFLEDSDWDIESFGKMSNFSKGTSRSAFGDGRIRGLESIYLQRIETSMKKGKPSKGTKGNQSKAKFRVMQDRFMDEVDVYQQERALNEHSSGISQGQSRNKNNKFMESANTTAMAQNRSDANIFQKQKQRALNQTKYRD